MTKKLRFNNRYNSGSVTFLILPEKNKYLGVCLEFDLIVRADTLKEAKEEIEDYAKLWHVNAVKHKLPEELLNKPAPKKYWNIYAKLVEQDLKRLEAEKQTSKNVGIEPQQVVSYQSPYPNFACA